MAGTTQKGKSSVSTQNAISSASIKDEGIKQAVIKNASMKAFDLVALAQRGETLPRGTYVEKTGKTTAALFSVTNEADLHDCGISYAAGTKEVLQVSPEPTFSKKDAETIVSELKGWGDVRF